MRPTLEKQSLNSAHQRHLLVRCRHADKLLSDIEGILNAAGSKSPFPKYRIDISPAQARIVADYIARIRTRMVRVLDGVGLRPPEPDFGARHSIRATLAFVRVAFQEIAPRHLAGYGRVPEALIPELEGLAAELEGLASELDAFLARDPELDLRQRLERLGKTTDETGLAPELEQIITAHGLVEFRRPFATLVDRS